MSEYIERDKLVDALGKLCDRVCQYSKRQRKVMCGACPLGDAFAVIEDDIPAADVRPVVRVKWIEDWETGCSECPACHDTFLWEDYKGVAEWNFCPNCGADMREGET